MQSHDIASSGPIAYRICKQCGTIIKPNGRSKAGQPAQVHAGCRDEYRKARNLERARKSRAKEKTTEAQPRSDGSHRIKKRCGLCYGITDRRPINGNCPRCLEPYEKETVKCVITTANGWTW
jgi:hypothetical protein